MNQPRRSRTPCIAILGAGPIGLEAALEASGRGYDVTVFEAGRVGESMRRFAWVRLFTPFRMNSTELGRSLAAAAGTGVTLPSLDSVPTAGDLVASYLEPLAKGPALAGRVHEHSYVSNIGREGVFKSGGIVAAGDRSRVGRPFLLRIESKDGVVRMERADIVVDATGVYRTPCAAGLGGLPALGEEHLGAALERHIAPIAGDGRDRYARRRVLLIGDGFSAATALAEFDDLARRGEAAQVTWVRAGRAEDPFKVICGDPLTERAALAAKGNEIARSAGWLTDCPGAAVESYEPSGHAWRATVRSDAGELRHVEIDRVLALVGYQPDLSIHREVQFHSCYASEGTMALASAILTASTSNPSADGDCLKQVSHGPEVLRNPEPDFYVIGAKSYGRNAHFLMQLGHQQVRDIFGLIDDDWAGRNLSQRAVSTAG